MTLRLAAAEAQAARFRDDLARLCDVAGDTVLVAVSGGPDSVALLLLARAVLGERCVAATVDHGLRPEAAGEAAWVARLCGELGVAHATLAAPLPRRAGRTGNVSARARALRYRLLEAHAADTGAARIATAHHADDQLETLVMRLNRGAGVAGLAGVRARGGRIVRPLLGWRRAELAALVAASGIMPVDDPTNRDERFDRARLRRVLADAGWLDAEQWGRSAAALGDAEEALAWTARRMEAECCSFLPGEARLDARALPFELGRRLVERCLAHVQPGINPRGAALAEAVGRLSRGDTFTLGDVLCTGAATGEWRFVPAPPRRSP